MNSRNKPVPIGDLVPDALEEIKRRARKKGLEKRKLGGK